MQNIWEFGNSPRLREKFVQLQMRCKNEILIMQLLQIPYGLYNHWGLGVFFGYCVVLSSWHLLLLQEGLTFQWQIKEFL